MTIGVIFGYYIPLYSFDKESESWQRGFYSLSLGSQLSTFEVERPIAIQSDTYHEESLFSVAFTGLAPDSSKKVPLRAGQTTIIGELAVWNDEENLYLEFSLTGTWVMEESAISCSLLPPNKNPPPGQFPYKSAHNPNVNYYLYTIPLASADSPVHDWPVGTELYILAHAAVKSGAKCEETAWAGDIEWTGPGKWFWYLKYTIQPPSSYICVDLSGTVSSWFIRKPGDYYASVITSKIRASHDFAITFSGFDDPLEIDIGESIQIFYSFGETNPDMSDWIEAPEINSIHIDLPAKENTQWRVWQRIINDYQSVGTYSNKGVVTFTLKNVRVQTVE